MPFPQCKVYSDGSHYIAIPHTTRPYRPRRKPKEEIIAVTEELAEEETKEQALLEQSAPSQEDAPMPLENIVKEATEGTQIDDTLNEKPAATRLMTKKELFEELYARYQNLPRYKRKALILKEMRPYFKDMDDKVCICAEQPAEGIVQNLRDVIVFLRIRLVNSEYRC